MDRENTDDSADGVRLQPLVSGLTYEAAFLKSLPVKPCAGFDRHQASLSFFPPLVTAEGISSLWTFLSRRQPGLADYTCCDVSAAESGSESLRRHSEQRSCVFQRSASAHGHRVLRGGVKLYVAQPQDAGEQAEYLSRSRGVSELVDVSQAGSAIQRQPAAFQVF